MIDGFILHDKSKLSNNKLRTLRQDILEALTLKANLQTLEGYGNLNTTIEFGQTNPSTIIIDQKRVIEQSFTITFDVEVTMGV